jgi:hypothetical protein
LQDARYHQILNAEGQLQCSLSQPKEGNAQDQKSLLSEKEVDEDEAAEEEAESESPESTTPHSLFPFSLFPSPASNPQDNPPERVKFLKS